MKYEVKDDARTLQFNGEKLGQSSSWRKGSDRWIEFELYKTEAGTFVLARIGVSLIFHTSTCPLVSKYNLRGYTTDTLEEDASPCEQCLPTYNLPIVFPEKYRYWALVTEDPEMVLDALYKEDQITGARYLTQVARRLLQEASEADSEIDSVYRIEVIP